MPNTVSIVIATFNDAQNLAITLESLRAQSGPHHGEMQVIVSDGGSDDDTANILDYYSDVVTLVDSRPDAGVYDAMNRGAWIATSDWLHFLNAGDTFADAESLSVWSKTVDSSIADYAWIVSGAMNMRSLKAPPVRIPSIPHIWWRHALGLQPHCHQATWFRRTVFEALGGYSLDKGFAGDFDLIVRFGMISRPLEIETPIIHYLGGGMSELRGAEIPGLLHTIRVERLNLGLGAAALDVAVTSVIQHYNGIRRRLGAIRLRSSGQGGRHPATKRAFARRSGLFSSSQFLRCR